MDNRCRGCGTKSEELKTSIRKETFCPTCWELYLRSAPWGKLEIFIAVAKGEETKDKYEEFLFRWLTHLWLKHKDELDMSDEERADIEAKAKEVGIFMEAPTKEQLVFEYKQKAQEKLNELKNKQEAVKKSV